MAAWLAARDGGGLTSSGACLDPPSSAKGGLTAQKPSELVQVVASDDVDAGLQRTWAGVAQLAPVPPARHAYLQRHPEVTPSELNELSTATGCPSPPTPPCDGMADRLRLKPSIDMRFNGLTFKLLGLPVGGWTAIAALKERATEKVVHLLNDMGLGLDDLSTKSLRVHLDEIPKGGPTNNTGVDFEITLACTPARDDLIRFPLRPFPARSDPHSATGILCSRPVDDSRWEFPLPAQSLATFVTLATALGVTESDHKAVASLASQLITRATGLPNVYAWTRSQCSSDDAKATQKLMVCVDTIDMPNLPPSISVLGVTIPLPALSSTALRSITNSLFSHNQIRASTTSRHVVIGPISFASQHPRTPTPSDWAHMMDTVRSVRKELEDANPDSTVHILGERGEPPHGALVSLPTAEIAAKMRNSFSLEGLPTLSRVWDTTGSLCVGVEGPPKCLQVMTVDQLVTIALRCGRTPRPPRPRDRASRGAPTPAPRASGPRPGPGPDNPAPSQSIPLR